MWEILERGEILFLDQPLAAVLEPQGGPRRRIVLTREHRADLPYERMWGRVDAVGTALDDFGAGTGARGVYALFCHGGHAHLVVRLESVRVGNPGELGTAKEASFIVAVKNPGEPTPPGIGLPGPHAVHLPRPLQQRFHGRGFVAAAPDLLDQEGVELVLIAADEDIPAELDVQMRADAETLDTADVLAEIGVRQ